LTIQIKNRKTHQRTQILSAFSQTLEYTCTCQWKVLIAIVFPVLFLRCAASEKNAPPHARREYEKLISHRAVKNNNTIAK
jgi:hypothetical protein